MIKLQTNPITSSGENEERVLLLKFPNTEERVLLLNLIIKKAILLLFRQKRSV